MASVKRKWLCGGSRDGKKLIVHMGRWRPRPSDGCSNHQSRDKGKNMASYDLVLFLWRMEGETVNPSLRYISRLCKNTSATAWLLITNAARTSFEDLTMSKAALLPANFFISLLMKAANCNVCSHQNRFD